MKNCIITAITVFSTTLCISEAAMGGEYILITAENVDSIGDVVPQIGDVPLAAENVGISMMGSINADILAYAAFDYLPPTVIADEDGKVYQDEHRTIIIDDETAMFGYKSWSRNEVHTEVEFELSPSAVMDIAEELVEYLEFPTEEIGDYSVNYVSVAWEDTETMEVRTNVIEAMVTIYREIEGYRVTGSKIRVIISSVGEVERYHAFWPDVTIPASLVLRQQQEVIEEVSSTILPSVEQQDIHVRFNIVYRCPEIGIVGEYLPSLKIDLKTDDDEPKQTLYVDLAY